MLTVCVSERWLKTVAFSEYFKKKEEVVAGVRLGLTGQIVLVTAKLSMRNLKVNFPRSSVAQMKLKGHSQGSLNIPVTSS